MKCKLLLSFLKSSPLKTCLLLPALLSILHAQAQKPRFGVKAGITIANCRIKSADPGTGTSKRISVIGGVFVHIPINKKFSLRPGVEFVCKGSLIKGRYTDPYNSYSFTRQFHLSYLDFPVNLLYEIPVRANKLFFGGGPVLSFLMNKELNQGIVNNDDFGVNLLAGYEWPIGASIFINYTHGFKNISAAHIFGNKITNYYFGITLGYWF
jgi:hypothetical protein